MIKYAAAAVTTLLCMTQLQAAVVLTANPAAPALGADAQYNLVDDHVGSGWPYNVSSYSDRSPGQTFTVPAASSLKLESFSLKGSGESGGNAGGQTWTVAVSSVSGSTYTPILTVSNIGGSAVTDNTTDWLTWSFTDGDALTLTGGATYAVQVWSSATYVGFAASNVGDNHYAGGEAFAPNAEWGSGMYTFGYDRTFVANLAAVPEPALTGLLAGSMGLLLRRRHRCA